MRATAGGGVRITWRTEEPVWIEQWPLTEEKLKAAREIVDRELQAGHLQESYSPWNTPIFVIKKKASGKFRLLHDLRAVNSQMMGMGSFQPGLPLISTIPRGWPAVALDVKDCFFSIPLHPDDCRRFAFTVPHTNLDAPAKRYQWMVLPQGMKNSPALCQTYVARALQPVRDHWPDMKIIHYMDDILLAAEEDKHLEQALQEVKQNLEEAGLQLSEAKLQRGSDIKYLGCCISPTEVRPLRIELNPKVTTLHDVQKLVGALQWLRPIIGIMPQEMSPLHDLLKGKAPWEPRHLTPEAQKSLRNIEQRMATAGLGRWDPQAPITAMLKVTKAGLIGALAQNEAAKVRILLWLFSNQVGTAFLPITAATAKVITKARKACCRHFSKDPDVIVTSIPKATWNAYFAQDEEVVLALHTFGGVLQHGKTPAMLESLQHCFPEIKPRVLPQPQPGPTFFTDASSRTSTAAVVWYKDEQWHKATWQQEASVQWLEAKAVCMALALGPNSHANITTDSIFVHNLVNRMAQPGFVGSDICMMLEEALQSRTAPCTIMHVNSHQSLPGFFYEGNSLADGAAKGIWTMTEAKEVHDFLHLGPRALAKHSGIPLARAREIVAACPYCQKTPLWEAGVNPRGLKGNEIWQTDFTYFPEFKPRPWLAVTIDTCSTVIIATQHQKQTARAAQSHWNLAIAWLGVPAKIKTDNGPCFISQSTAEWAQLWGIVLLRGLPYNSTGQAIVERANQTLKSKIKSLAEAEGCGGGIPPEKQAMLLHRALYVLNHHSRGDCPMEPVRRHWGHLPPSTGPGVKVRFPGEGEWETGWELISQGRGYAAIKREEQIRWVPMKCIKPDLNARTKGSGV
nr:PREDICTED: endogenous retrovirus group K member 113 Pol protein-like [Apteryx mantelli mantelli]